MIAKRLQVIAARLAFFSASKKYKYTFQNGSHMIPHPAKAYKGGEDAIYVSDNVLVVADGVGGWADSGVDPGLYSKQLCNIIGKKIEKNLQKYVNDPKTLLSQAVKQNKQTGSTTVCILTLNPTNGKIINYYLGDSVFGIFYPEKYFMAEDQQKSFNFPYQVGSVGDDPSEGITYELDAEEHLQGTFVLASDGIWDNYEADQIRADIFEKNKEKSLNQIALFIAKNTYKFSLMQNYESPFYKKALQSGLKYYKSGKSDDISIVLGRIRKQQL